MSKLTYLAVPYSHPDRAIRLARFKAANIAAGALMAQGHIVFSPISHSHPIAEDCELPKGWDFWEAFDRAYLDASRLLVVLCIDGWQESVGVQAEIALAKELGLPLEFMEAPDGLMVEPERRAHEHMECSLCDLPANQLELDPDDYFACGPCLRAQIEEEACMHDAPEVKA